MSSRCLSAVALALALGFSVHAAARVVRVCADPDNLPYSHADGSGFENRIAGLVAQELGAALQYEWLPQRRGFVRKTLGEGRCDLFIGVPSDFERVLTTRPYYRSAYVFVYRAGAGVLRSFDDPSLRSMKLGVQLVGNDLAATPPGHALARRGIVDNVTGFTVYGDGPAAQRLVDAIAQHRLDAGVVWGPQAAYFAKRAAAPLETRVATPPADLARMPFEFSISMGVRRGDTALRDELDAVLVRRRADIDAILADYAVPRTDRLPP
jgi:quinoprotein dehydrogenase-associated probable ABC transporter substrate-binding protein